MAGFTAAVAAIGIGMQVYGQYQSGQDAKSAAEYNAAIYRQQAAVIDVKKGLTAQNYDRAINRLRGATITAVASSGYDLSGSFLAVMNDSLTQAFLDKETELYNLEVQKNMALSGASEASRSGSIAERSANVNAVSTLLTTGNDWYSKYGGFGTTGGTGGPA